MKLLVQTQLSNYTRDGKFILECDSGWQMAMGRVRELRKLVPGLQVDVTGPLREQLITQPEAVTPWMEGIVKYLPHYVPPNAVVSRHHFDSRDLKLDAYDTAYINDPMQLRNYKVLLQGKCKRFVVHNHFIDNPSCPKFPVEISLWLGQCEAVKRADWNFWQCESALRTFEGDYGAKAPRSAVWDDGYSYTEVQSPVDLRNVRFDPELLKRKPIVFIPNRVGGRGRSSDYTNCGKFLFEMLPKLRRSLGSTFDVVAGNPGQKFSNQELVDECGVLLLTPNAFTRDEYKLVAANSAVVVALYDKDTYGGTAVRECIDLGCLPLWLDCNEYAAIARAAEYPFFAKFEELLFLPEKQRKMYSDRLRRVVRNRCSFEETTKEALQWLL